ncbi:mucin-17 isoform X2 [Drosophila tropicalis]|uniref:mucin-17 isoform X2 n=1 Tax=Drosophila tropicalis TaxID=46794 RepID=UPI0035ABC117
MNNNVGQCEEELNQMRQQIALANASDMLAKITNKCFHTCINKPGSELVGSEQSCIAQCMDRYLESFNLVSRAYGQRLRRETSFFKLRPSSHSDISKLSTHIHIWSGLVQKNLNESKEHTRPTMDQREIIMEDQGPMTDFETAVEMGTVIVMEPVDGELMPIVIEGASGPPPPLIPLLVSASKKTFYLKTFQGQYCELQPQKIDSISSKVQHQGAIPKSSSKRSSVEKGPTKFSVPNVMKTERPVGVPVLGSASEKRIPFKPILPQNIAPIKPEPEERNVMETAKSKTVRSQISVPKSGSIPESRMPYKLKPWQHFATVVTEPEETRSTMPSASSVKQRHLNSKTLMTNSTKVTPKIEAVTIPKITQKSAMPSVTNGVGKQLPISTCTSKEHPFTNFGTIGGYSPATTSTMDPIGPLKARKSSIQSKLKMKRASVEPPITSSSEDEMQFPQKPPERTVQRKSRKQKLLVRPEEALASPNQLMTLDPTPPTASFGGAKRHLPNTSKFKKKSKTTKALVSRANIGDLKSDDESITPSMALQTYSPSTSSGSMSQLSTGLSSEKRTKIQEKKKTSSVPTATVTGPPVAVPLKDSSLPPKTNLEKDQAASTASLDKRSQRKLKKQMKKKAKANKLPATSCIPNAQLPMVSIATSAASVTSTTNTFTSYKLMKCPCTANMPAELPLVTTPMTVQAIPQTLTLPVAPKVEQPLTPKGQLPIAPIGQLPMALPPRTCVANPQPIVAPIPEEYTLFQPSDWQMSMSTAQDLELSTDPFYMSVPMMTEPPLLLMAPMPETSPIQEPYGNNDGMPNEDEDPTNTESGDFGPNC